MHEHKKTITMDREVCPTRGKVLKDIPTKKEEPKKPKTKKTKK